MLEFVKDLIGHLACTLAERMEYRCPVCGSYGLIKVVVNLPAIISRPDNEPLLFDVCVNKMYCLDCGYTRFDNREFRAAMRFEHDLQKAVNRLYRAGGMVRLPSEKEELKI